MLKQEHQQQLPLSFLRGCSTTHEQQQEFPSFFLHFFCVNGLRGKGGFKEVKSLLGLLLCALQLSLQPPSETAFASPAPPKLASQSCDFSSNGEVASCTGEMPFHIKSPAPLAVWPSTCRMAAKSPLQVAVCLEIACSSHKKEHHVGNCSKRTPFGE